MTNNYPHIKVKKLFPDAKLPVRANPTDSGLDVFAYKFEKIYEGGGVLSGDDNYPRKVDPSPNHTGYIELPTGCRVLVNSGVSIAVPVGFEVQVRPRSGLALKNGLTILNSPGTIDSSYRGMVGCIVINHSGTLQKISLGDKIAQLVVAPVVLSEVVEVEILDDTERGEGGFGSTGT